MRLFRRAPGPDEVLGAIHNLRNALNPLTTILTQDRDGRPAIDREMVDRALAELAQADVPLARREKLAAFVTACVTALEAARSEQAEQFAAGREVLANVLDVVGEQHAFPRGHSTVGACDITAVIARSATIARYSVDAPIVFTVPGEPHVVLGSRAVLSQVIGNLFANAAEAVGAAGRVDGSITVTAETLSAVVRVRIRDNGEGFRPGAAALLFKRGFSTRTHKVGGLGLHWCVGAVTAMGGSLTLRSDGEGCGAVAELILPAMTDQRLAG